MKPIIKFIMILSLLIGLYFLSKAQTVSDTSRLELGKVAPYKMEVTYNKTSHIIFPAAIRYVDLGSEWLVAGKATDAENVLRVKAAVRDFKEETNFSVITNDGRFYNFNVAYNASPATLNFDLQQMPKHADRTTGNDVLFEELGSNTPSLTSLIMQSIYDRNKKYIRRIKTESYGIQLLLKGIYIHNGLFYFHTELQNNSNIPYNIDFVTFKIVDKKLAKRTVVQERMLTPLRMLKPFVQVTDNTTDQNVFLLDQFTLADDKVLVIEIFEKNGGRQLRLKINNNTLIKAKIIRNMRLKFNSAE